MGKGAYDKKKVSRKQKHTVALAKVANAAKAIHGTPTRVVAEALLFGLTRERVIAKDGPQYLHGVATIMKEKDGIAAVALKQHGAPTRMSLMMTGEKVGIAIKIPGEGCQGSWCPRGIGSS